MALTYCDQLQVVFVEGGVAANVVPDAATVTINHRVAPDRSRDEAAAWLRDYLGDLLEDVDGFTVLDWAPSAPPSLTNERLGSAGGADRTARFEENLAGLTSRRSTNSPFRRQTLARETHCSLIAATKRSLGARSTTLSVCCANGWRESALVAAQNRDHAPKDADLARIELHGLHR